jgi:hypothetical protein
MTPFKQDGKADVAKAAVALPTAAVRFDWGAV